MMNILSTTGIAGFNSGIVWLIIHKFFSVFVLVGFIFLVVWALRASSKDKLKSLAIWFLLIGMVGALLTAVPALAGFQDVMNIWGGRKSMMGMGQGNPMMMQMMQKMMQHGEAGEGKDEEHEEIFEMMRTMMNQGGGGAANQEGMMSR